MRFVSLVLAAGAGERFGGAKLTAELLGRPLLAYALGAASAASDEVIVIAAPALTDCAQAWCETARVLTVDEPSEGLSTSLRTGLAALDRDVDAAFVFLGDMPLVPHDICAALREAMLEGAPAAAPVCNGQRGHPVALGRALIARHGELRGDRGAGVLLATDPGFVAIPTDDDGVLFDVDTVGDLKRAEQRLYLR